jgi:protein-arginine kinase activator protein McsA
MLKARCKLCNTELTSTSKVQFCGCSNQMKVVDDTVGAIDLSQVVLIEHEKNIKYDGILTQEDLQYQENRRRRKVRRLDFEER